MTAADDASANAADDDDAPTARVRGIYATALTYTLLESGIAVVQPSGPIRERFDDDLAVAPADATVESTRDRQGVEISGEPAAVERVASTLESVAVDTFRWEAAAPRGAVYDCSVSDAGGGGGATVDLGDGARGYLPYDAVDDYVEAGNRYRVQVREPAPPWDDDRPRVAPALEVGTGLLTLTRGKRGVTAATRGERANELVGMTDLLPPSVPDGWGLRWREAALEADLDAMGRALEQSVERVETLEAALSSADGEADSAEPGQLAAPVATAWVWFGRESRRALDASRQAVTTTMAGHHRIKAASRSASAAVDFAEALLAERTDSSDDDSGDGPGDADAFPFAAVARQYGPLEGDRLALGHGKPDGRLLTLGTGEVTDWDADGHLTLERRMRGGGTYDALDVPKEEGDVAITKLREGRWWYSTTYKGADGTVKGTYVNVCTPVELFPDCARYVDLYVDVIRRPDGTVSVVDEDELEAAHAEGLVADDLAKKARSVARGVERALSK